MNTLASEWSVKVLLVEGGPEEQNKKERSAVIKAKVEIQGHACYLEHP